MISKHVKYSIKAILLFGSVIFLGCSLGDYSKNIGGGYSLEKTNTCCVFIMSKHEVPISKNGSIIYNNRVITPLITELYIDDKKIVGFKSGNECCYLADDEQNQETPNGYFVIDKKNGKVLEGISEKVLQDLNISIESMEHVFL